MYNANCIVYHIFCMNLKLNINAVQSTVKYLYLLPVLLYRGLGEVSLHNLYNTVHKQTVQFGVVHKQTVQHGAVHKRYSTLQYTTLQYSTVQYGTVQ